MPNPDSVPIPSLAAWLRALWKWIGRHGAYGRAVLEMAGPRWPPGAGGEPRDGAVREAPTRRGRA